MKTAIHPDYHQITVRCACGNTFITGSTHKEDLRVEICAQCHPLYTGKSKLVDAAGRVDKFQARQQRAQEHREAANARLTPKTDSVVEDTSSAKSKKSAK